MSEPTAVSLVRVLDAKQEIIRGVTLQIANPNKPSALEHPPLPWLPYVVLIPPNLQHAFRTIFPEEYKDPGVETRIMQGLGFSRSVIALYRDAPRPRKKTAEEIQAEVDAREQARLDVEAQAKAKAAADEEAKRLAAGQGAK